jgi:16S rRNA pseudouridine516 synthase
MKLRLDRILTSQGLASRSEGARLIKKGRVAVNGEVLKSPKEKVETEGLVITLDEVDYPYTEFVYIMLHKPEGYECSDNPKDHTPVKELLSWEHRNREVISAGRLDQDTTGLLLFSDDGKFIHHIASPKHHLPKVYEVQLRDTLTQQGADALLKGVLLDDDPKPATALAVTGVDTTAATLTIDEGRYHQVKRMFAAIGNEVLALHRSSTGELKLSLDLPKGEWRLLNQDDLKLLNY